VAHGFVCWSFEVVNFRFVSTFSSFFVFALSTLAFTRSGWSFSMKGGTAACLLVEIRISLEIACRCENRESSSQPIFSLSSVAYRYMGVPTEKPRINFQHHYLDDFAVLRVKSIKLCAS
jgi:hypothetical protein